MHHVRIAFDDHFLGKLDATSTRDAPDIVPPQVDQHQVFGDLFGIGEQFLFQRKVLFLVLTTRTRAGDRPHRHHAIFIAHQNLR